MTDNVKIFLFIGLAGAAGHGREPAVVGGNVQDDRVVVISKHREELPKLGSARFLTAHR